MSDEIVPLFDMILGRAYAVKLRFPPPGIAIVKFQADPLEVIQRETPGGSHGLCSYGLSMYCEMFYICSDSAALRTFAK